jgi:hypothetical protein
MVLVLGLWYLELSPHAMVEHLYEDSVELRNVSRVKIANASDEAIVRPGSAD